ncbi:hypothetical protein NPIL_55521 [Nephila pilipes]|uniref:Uncharacterized protein n=1 Tax=Nephila pilipes TaxID=299642 RepID=A0A8X6T3T1_NEPPI|nr:hypothetical protein NPIL_55521 [Nephila pilipes]
MTFYPENRSESESSVNKFISSFVKGEEAYANEKAAPKYFKARKPLPRDAFAEPYSFSHIQIRKCFPNSISFLHFMTCCNFFSFTVSREDSFRSVKLAQDFRLLYMLQILLEFLLG